MSSRRSPVTQEEREKLDKIWADAMKVTPADPNWRRGAVSYGWFQCPECGVIGVIGSSCDEYTLCINRYTTDTIYKPNCQGRIRNPYYEKNSPAPQHHSGSCFMK